MGFLLRSAMQVLAGVEGESPRRASIVPLAAQTTAAQALKLLLRLLLLRLMLLKGHLVYKPRSS